MSRANVYRAVWGEVQRGVNYRRHDIEDGNIPVRMTWHLQAPVVVSIREQRTDGDGDSLLGGASGLCKHQGVTLT